MSNIITGQTRLVPGLIEKLDSKPVTLGNPESAPSEQFSDVFANLIDSVNDLHMQAGDAQKAFITGEPIELHVVMIKSAEAGIATDLVLEIRNKLVNAYNELLRMPM